VDIEPARLGSLWRRDRSWARLGSFANSSWLGWLVSQLENSRASPWQQGSSPREAGARGGGIIGSSTRARRGRQGGLAMGLYAVKQLELGAGSWRARRGPRDDGCRPAAGLGTKIAVERPLRIGDSREGIGQGRDFFFCKGGWEMDG